MARKKQKKLNILPTDQVVGYQERAKKDLLAGCNEPGKAWYTVNAHEFIRVYCNNCKNADCIRAKGAVSPWATRMAEQVDYLLNHPVFSELDTEDHRSIAQQAFEDISAKATRLEIARQRQDWTIPEGPTDGFERVVERSTTDQFDDAVKELAKAKGKTEPVLPTPESNEAPTHFEKADDPPVEDKAIETEETKPPVYQTLYPSSDGITNYQVKLNADGSWFCECPGWERVQKCRHATAVREWYEQQLAEGLDTVPQPPPEAPPPRPVTDGLYNTPMPRNGVMVGGGNAPHEAPSQLPPEPHDPWTPRKDHVVQPGAVVTLSGDKKK